MAGTADYGLGEFTFPRGWFMVADAEDLKAGPLAVRFFARDFALYRGKSGKVVMLEAYCPHMGTHLAKNTSSYVVRDGEQIEGDSIRCPYHAWRFGPDGKCDDIPYSDKIPKAACVKSWTVVERAGAIWVWHDPEEQEPDIALPPFAQWDDPAWVRWKFDHMGVLATHPQEILDNMADSPHLGPVHGAPVVYFENEFRGPICVQRQGGRARWQGEDGALLETHTWYTGPAILQSFYTGYMDSLVIITHAPIDDGVVKVWHGLMAKSPHEVATEEDVAAARAYQAAACEAFAQDFEIWANKRPALNLLQIPEDGPFGKNRIWYSQFYNPRAKVPEILRRIEGVHGVKGLPAAPKREAA
jgi:3-ketosteroid 9alpha-monooxygenase subunit A